MELTGRRPAISVLLPVYNNERHLKAAVDSILGQTFGDFEFIIIDDGSTDTSLEILEAYAKQDPRIRLFSRPNAGFCRTLNEGLSHAMGEFIGRMDADDIAMPDRFERQVAYLKDHPECVLMGGRILLIDEEGAPICEMCLEETHEAIDSAHMAGRGGSIAHPAMMARRSAVEAIGGYASEYEYAEDLDFCLRLAEAGRVANLPETVLHYRQHLSSLSYQRTEQQRRSAIKAIQDAHRRRGLAMPDNLVETPIHVPGIAEIHRKWAWWALGAGNVGSARKHARRALGLEPFSADSWRVLLCSLRGH